jgi:capsular exopolysaccharide synthesis family protein
MSDANGVDLREYLAVLRRRIIVIAVATVVSLAGAIGYSAMQTPVYVGHAEVLVNPPPGNTNQNLSQVISMDTEARLVTSAPIADAASQILDSPLTITELLKRVSVQTSPDTFVMDISYWDTNPKRAAAGANAFARSYLDFKRQQALQEISQKQQALLDQMAEIQKQQRELSRILDSNPPGTTAYRDAQRQLDQLNVRWGYLSSQLASVPPLADPGQVILPATPPTSPSSPKPPLNAALGLFLGLFCGVVLAFVLDRTDDRVHRREDIHLYVDAPVLAEVPHVKNRSRGRAAQLVVHLQPRGAAAEAYRTIRTSVLSMAHRSNIKIIAVVSPEQQEGKSMTAANLAAALGQADKRVLVLSGDIRKPTIHEYFAVSNDIGVSEVLAGDVPLAKAVVRAEVSNVWVLPGGDVPAQPAELLESPAMGELIQQVDEAFDFVIVDCPPVLGLADCLSIAPLVDATLMVVQAGRTRGGAIAEACERLERVGASVDAVVMNDVKVHRGRPGHPAYGYYVASHQYRRTKGEARLRPAPRMVEPRLIGPEQPPQGGNGSAAVDPHLPKPALGVGDDG